MGPGAAQLPPLEMAMLGYLATHLPGGEGTLTHAEVAQFFERYNPATPRRVLASLRRRGLIEYQPDRRGQTFRAAAPASPQGVLNLAEFESTSESSGGCRFESTSESGANSCSEIPPPPDPPMHVPVGDSLLGDRRSKTRKDSSRAELAREALLKRLRAVRKGVAGRAKLDAVEYDLCSAILNAGGTAGGLEEAAATYRLRLAEGHAPPGERGWRYLLGIWRRDVEARHGFAGQASPASPASPKRVPSGHGARRATAASQSVEQTAENAFRDWEAKYGGR